VGLAANREAISAVTRMAMTLTRGREGRNM
jgi:hypothetical protein